MENTVSKSIDAADLVKKYLTLSAIKEEEELFLFNDNGIITFEDRQ